MSPEDLEMDAAQGGGHGSSQFGHVPVLYKEAIEFLAVRRGGTYIDATVGLGGHSYEIARRLGAQGRLIGFDKDPKALEIAGKRLREPPPEMAGDSRANQVVQGRVIQGGAKGDA